MLIGALPGARFARDGASRLCGLRPGAVAPLLRDLLRFRCALGRTDEEIRLPAFLHFGVRLPSAEAVRQFRERLAADGIPIAEEWNEPEYVSVKCRDPDGYVVEAAWEPTS
jgi:catechol 2,3-dioxygenase-like lactoylglutathione lyase family enzyme